MLRVHPFQKNHLQEAAELVVNRTKHLCTLEPLLPDRYCHVSNILPQLENLYNTGSPGVVAIQDGRLAGFLMGWTMEEFRGKKSTYSPEWANAAIPGHSKFIYQEMYTSLAASWVHEQCIAHYISILANDAEAITACQWLGFGMLGVDAIRGMQPVRSKAAEIDIRLASSQDLKDVIALNQGLRDYMIGAPNFLILDEVDEPYLQSWIEDPQREIWLAYADGEPVAFFRIGPANQDVSLIIVDEKTTSIYGAFTKENERGKEIASALLQKTIQRGQSRGYHRCAVDFETMNTLGSRFWLRHFNPVCYSLVRFIDERLVES